MKDFPLNNPLLTQEQYDQMYAESFANKEQFWSNIAKEQVTWFKDFTKVKNTNYEGDVSIKWFEDGELNVCYNCVEMILANQKPIPIKNYKVRSVDLPMFSKNLE